MRIGLMDTRITLRQPTTTTNSYGEEVISFADYGNGWWAQKLQPGAREVYATGGKISEVDCIFRIHYLSAVDETWQIIEDGTTYKITGKPKELGRQMGLEIMAQVQQ